MKNHAPEQVDATSSRVWDVGQDYNNLLSGIVALNILRSWASGKVFQVISCNINPHCRAISSLVAEPLAA